MLAASAQKFNKNLRVHIVCAGLPYGNGEMNNVFYEFFRRAWLSLHPDLAALPIIDGGKNRLPTIHVTDLAHCIRHLINHSVGQLYFFAVDQAKQ
jgi:nucleoside-diphosphate-sugar epimerase